MKNYTIDMIQAMTETDAAAIALEKLDVKGHTVYLVDFGGYFGYSCLVCLRAKRQTASRMMRLFGMRC